MFYSHDILTERTYGIATIWSTPLPSVHFHPIQITAVSNGAVCRLVATLGVSRTIQRKLGRKEILSVNLPKACDTVTNPKVPLALRLQSNLLVGISRYIPFLLPGQQFCEWDGGASADWWCRVYKQQFEYLYYDVAHTHTNIRKLDCLTRDPRLNLARGGEGR